MPSGISRRNRCAFIPVMVSISGPRLHDMPLQDIIDIMLKINAGAYSFEAANPRHEHEWRVLESVKLPEATVLIPGVISHTTNLIEHPELVAERLVKYADIVGRERVIAGSDCGFSSFASAEPGTSHRRVGQIPGDG